MITIWEDTKGYTVSIEGGGMNAVHVVQGIPIKDAVAVYHYLNGGNLVPMPLVNLIIGDKK